MSKATQFMIHTHTHTPIKRMQEKLLKLSVLQNIQKEKKNTHINTGERMASEGEWKSERTTNNTSPLSHAIDNIMCSMLSQCIGCCRRAEHSPNVCLALTHSLARSFCFAVCEFDFFLAFPVFCQLSYSSHSRLSFSFSISLSSVTFISFLFIFRFEICCYTKNTYIDIIS